MGRGSNALRRGSRGLGTFSTELSLDETFVDRWFRGDQVRMPAHVSGDDGALTARKVSQSSGVLEVIDTTTWSLAARGGVAVRLVPDDGIAVDTAVRCPRRPSRGIVPLPERFFPDGGTGAAVAAAASAETNHRALLVASRTPFRERVWEVRNRARKIVAYAQAFDIAPAAGSSVTARFIRLLPLRGYRRIVDEMMRGFGAVPAYTIVEEALALSGRRLFDYSTKVRLAIKGDEPAARTHALVIGYLRDTIRLNAPGVAAAIDTEFLHDLRVATRRMRTYIDYACASLPAEEVGRAREAVRRLARATGPARELDVLLLSRRRYAAMVEPMFESAVEAFFRYVEGRRAEAYDVVKREIERYLSDDAVDMLLDNTPPIGGPTRETARRVIKRRRRAFRRGWHALVEDYHLHHNEVTDEALHRLRIRGKRYRYVREILGEVSGIRANESVKKLKYFQDRLGRFNDLCVEQSRLADLIAAGDDLPPGVAAALGALVEAISREKRASREAVFEYLRRKAL